MKGNIITKVRGVCLVRGLFSLLCAAAVLFTACFGFDERPDEFGAGFVPVESITGVPTSGQPYVALGLTATVEPENATEKRIEWSITNDGGTQSTLDGARLTAREEGTVTVTARIKNGMADGVDYTEHFDILIAILVPYKVTDIYGIPAYLPIGEFTYTLNGTVEPSNANKNIVWSISPLDNGTTGATVTTAGFLSAARKGTVTVRAVIINGMLEDGDYTKDFKIDITRGVIAAGNYYRNAVDPSLAVSNPNLEGGPCYWVNGEFHELPGGRTTSTAGIAEANGKLYIAGLRISGNDWTIFYWLDGVEKTLPNSTGGNFSGAWTDCYGIAAGGGYVYILGQLASGNDSSTYYYWRINANDDSETPVRVTLAGGFRGTKLAVKNDGNVVIVGSDGDGIVYCMPETGNETTLTPVRIDAFDTLLIVGYALDMNNIAVVNNDVYISGWWGYGTVPYYYRIGDPSVNIFYNLDGTLLDSFQGYNYGVSVVEQNGAPLFYGLFYHNNNAISVFCYWKIGGNLVDIPMSFTGDLNLISVHSDGDVYIAVGSSGYIVLREQSIPFRKVSIPGDYKAYSTEIRGLVVR